MSKIRKSLAEKFPGDRNSAKIYMEEIKNIGHSVDVLDRHAKDNFPTQQGNNIRIILVKAIAEIISEIEIPITSKFPDLK